MCYINIFIALNFGNFFLQLVTPGQSDMSSDVFFTPKENDSDISNVGIEKKEIVPFFISKLDDSMDSHMEDRTVDSTTFDRLLSTINHGLDSGKSSQRI